MCYVRSVLSRAGLSLFIPVVDYHGIDGTIVDPERRGMNRIDFQIKATTRYGIGDAAISYDLRVEDYNRLISDDGVPRILILFIMPDDEDEWLAQGEEEMCLRKCSYWVSLMGFPVSPNSSTVRVSVPLTNVFDQNGLHGAFRELIG